MNKREEFEKALDALIEYAEQATRSYPLEPAREREYSGYADEEKAKLLTLFDAAQPSQDGLPELPEPTHYLMRKGTKLAIYDPGQMLAYGAQCRAAGQWIACSERLPEQQQQVLLTLDGYVSTARFKGERFICTDLGSPFTYVERLRWMPLPAPPIAAAKENT